MWVLLTPFGVVAILPSLNKNLKIIQNISNFYLKVMFGVRCGRVSIQKLRSNLELKVKFWIESLVGFDSKVRCRIGCLSQILIRNLVPIWVAWLNPQLINCGQIWMSELGLWSNLEVEIWIDYRRWLSIWASRSGPKLITKVDFHVKKLFFKEYFLLSNQK